LQKKLKRVGKKKKKKKKKGQGKKYTRLNCGGEIAF